MSASTSKLLVGMYFSRHNIKDDEEFQVSGSFKGWIGWEQGNVIIMSDFNYPDIDWAKGTAHSTKSLSFPKLRQFHGSDGRRPNALLDLLISNNRELITDLQVRDNLVIVISGVITLAKVAQMRGRLVWQALYIKKNKLQ